MTPKPRPDANSAEEVIDRLIELLAKADAAIDKAPNSPPHQRLAVEEFRSPLRWRALERLVRDGHLSVPRRKHGYGRIRLHPLEVVATDARRIKALCKANGIKLPHGLTAFAVALERSLRAGGIHVSEGERDYLAELWDWRVDHRSGPTGAQVHRRKKSRAKP